MKSDQVNLTREDLLGQEIIYGVMVIQQTFNILDKFNNIKILRIRQILKNPHINLKVQTKFHNQIRNITKTLAAVLN